MLLVFLERQISLFYPILCVMQHAFMYLQCKPTCVIMSWPKYLHNAMWQVSREVEARVEWLLTHTVWLSQGNHSLYPLWNRTSPVFPNPNHMGSVPKLNQSNMNLLHLAETQKARCICLDDTRRDALHCGCIGLDIQTCICWNLKYESALNSNMRHPKYAFKIMINLHFRRYLNACT